MLQNQRSGCRCADFTLRRSDGQCVAQDACELISNYESRNEFEDTQGVLISTNLGSGSSTGGGSSLRTGVQNSGRISPGTNSRVMIRNNVGNGRANSLESMSGNEFERGIPEAGSYEKPQ